MGHRLLGFTTLFPLVFLTSLVQASVLRGANASCIHTVASPAVEGLLGGCSTMGGRPSGMVL